MICILIYKSVLFQLKEKIDGENEDSRDGFVCSVSKDDDEATSVVSDRSQSLSTPAGPISTGKLASRGSRKSAEEDSLISSFEERSEQFLSIQKELLGQLRPNGDKERHTFIEWLRSVVHSLEQTMWRRCQRELSDVMYRIIAENDSLQARKQTQFQATEVSPNQSAVNLTQSAPICNRPSASWQPGPYYWPSSAQNSPSVWRSMDPAWVQQQFPQTNTQRQTVQKSSTDQPLTTQRDPTISSCSTEAPLSTLTDILRDIRESDDGAENIQYPGRRDDDSD